MLFVVVVINKSLKVSHLKRKMGINHVEENFQFAFPRENSN